MAAGISKARFAEAANARLMDTNDVRDAFGFRNRQSVFDGVARGTIPAPIFKRPGVVTFWDRLDIEPLTRR